jgi:hypothetical protein
LNSVDKFFNMYIRAGFVYYLKVNCFLNSYCLIYCKEIWFYRNLFMPLVLLTQNYHDLDISYSNCKNCLYNNNQIRKMFLFKIGKDKQKHKLTMKLHKITYSDGSKLKNGCYFKIKVTRYIMIEVDQRQSLTLLHNSTLQKRLNKK